MKILLTNDDGIYSKGLKAAYEALREIGEVFVVAPVVQMSAVGRSISIMHPIRISKLKVNEMEVYAVSGTPTDSVIVGIYEIIGEVPDLTVCGINLGENLSSEAVTTSGTVCAALEAATQGSKAIAISQEMPEKYKFFLTTEQDFGFAKKVLKWLAKKVVKRNFEFVFNVNVPAKPNGKIAFTKLAKKMYLTRVEKRFDPRGREYYWISGVEVESAEEGSDIDALKKGYVSITPISLDMTAKVDLGDLNDWKD
ncbi:MAG: 5'/3'-nucleotidase SurE [Archaeoglobaceae archaeon]|nr:5'/3'-nucleotidase SurE [Archaeoglobaceae archaeon]MCX8152544.1 5'/3'-nucleotidase SurE [Archaeoglobaceae archaeon]MDW8014035.1 5'/3'-nucleotidase SurE [Archaeoglobaceae archaeon]